MKKIYLSAFVSIFSVGMSLAQAVEREYSFDQVKLEEVKPMSNEINVKPKALGTTFWTEDFTAGLGNWTIDNSGQAGGAFGWTVDATVDGWWSTAGITSTSGGNYAELSNGDAQAGTQALNVIYTLTSEVIDFATLGGTDQITLTYEEYGARFNDLQEVQISVDGGAFTTVRNSDGYEALSASGGAPYANPENIAVNLAPYTTGGSTIQIRFSWTTGFPASASNPNVWITYGWYLDDIALTTNPDNDISSESSFWGTTGLNYHQIPLSQQTAIGFSTEAFNGGLNTQNEVQLNVDITGAATYSGSSPAGVSVAVGDTATLEVSTPFTPSGLGTYDVSWGITQTEIDDVPTNSLNEDVTFDVTEFIYARDKGVEESAFSNSGELFIMGSYYDIFANDVVYSVDVKVATGTIPGSVISARIYSLDPNATTFANLLILEDQSLEYTVQASDVNTIVNLDLALSGDPSGFPVVAGETYFVAVATDGDGGTTDGVSIGMTGNPIDQTCFLYDGPDDTWYLASGTPMVRMNLDPTSNNVGLDENGLFSGAQVFPNPATDNISVRYSMTAASDVTIKVTDLTGKVIAEYAEGTQTAGTHQLDMNSGSFAQGVYYVTIASGDSILTKKVVKK